MLTGSFVGVQGDAETDFHPYIDDFTVPVPCRRNGRRARCEAAADAREGRSSGSG